MSSEESEKQEREQAIRGAMALGIVGGGRGYQISYECPECRTELQFRKRVTMTKRRCPHCNHPVTVEEIDRQLYEKIVVHRKQVKKMFKGCLIVLVVLFVSSMLFLALTKIAEHSNWRRPDQRLDGAIRNADLFAELA